METQVLDGVKVLDFSWALVGSTTTKLLADHGATIVKVETSKRVDMCRIDRQVSISTSENLDDKPWFTDLNTSKYGILLDLKNPKSAPFVKKLVLWADVVMENFSPGVMAKLGMDYESLRKIKPDIIMASGSVYGQTGPMAKNWGVDGTGNALSSRLYLTGYPDRNPLAPSTTPYGDLVLPYILSGAIIAALDYRRRTGKGQYLDAGMFEVLVHQMAPAVMEYQATEIDPERNGNRSDQASPHGVFPCKGEDRWCAISVFTQKEWRAFCSAMGASEWAADGRFTTFALRKENEDELEALIAERTRGEDSFELMKRLQAAGVPAGVVQNYADVFNDPQLKEREYLADLEHPVLGKFGHLTPPFKLSKSKPAMRTAPCFGEHTDYVCTQILGLSDEEFIGYHRDGIFL